MRLSTPPNLAGPLEICNSVFPIAHAGHKSTISAEPRFVLLSSSCQTKLLLDVFNSSICPGPAYRSARLGMWPSTYTVEDMAVAKRLEVGPVSKRLADGSRQMQWRITKQRGGSKKPLWQYTAFADTSADQAAGLAGLRDIKFKA